MTLILCLLLAPLLLMNLVFIGEMLAGLPRNRTLSRSAARRGATIIIPAHNEAQGIGRTLRQLQTAAGANFRILVVADNCSDETAAIARGCGVQVAERANLNQRGKGFALAFARDLLRPGPPAAVIVLDADCRTDAASLHALTGHCEQTDRPCQAINLLEPTSSAPPLVQISTFAFFIKNLIRQRGLQRLSGGVHLTGTGMCLPWLHFDQADLATASIVEDVRLGLELARKGAHPELVQEATVWSAHSNLADTLPQRQRWEGGFIALARKTAPGLLLQGLKRFDLSLLVSGLDLLIPPLAILFLLNAAALATTAILAAVDWSNWLPAFALALAAAAAAALVLVAWAREGRPFLTPQALVRLPLYALWKVPMYLGLLRKGAPSEWRRAGRPTQRDREA